MWNTLKALWKCYTIITKTNLYSHTNAKHRQPLRRITSIKQSNIYQTYDAFEFCHNLYPVQTYACVRVTSGFTRHIPYYNKTPPRPLQSNRCPFLPISCTEQMSNTFCSTNLVLFCPQIHTYHPVVLASEEDSCPNGFVNVQKAAKGTVRVWL